MINDENIFMHMHSCTHMLHPFRFVHTIMMVIPHVHKIDLLMLFTKLCCVWHVKFLV